MIKILILTQNVSDINGMKKGLVQAQTLLTPILSISFDYKETKKQFTSIPLNSDVVHNGYEVNPDDILSEEKNSYDITCFIYNWDEIYPHPTNPCTNYSKSLTDVPMQIPANFYSNLTVTPIITYPEVLCEFFLHEFSHYIADIEGVSDLTHYKYQFSQFSQSSNIDYYLYLIKQNSPMPTYKYFKNSEVVGLKPELVSKLDQARGIAGVPFIITSGFRTQAQNIVVGGVPDSAHTTGEAVDLLVKDSNTRYRVILGLVEAGFNRIEDCKSHIHSDISKTLPQNVFIWSNDD